MKTPRHLLTILIACLLGFSACSDSPQLDFSGGAATPEELAARLIDATNGQDPVKHRSLIHPLSFHNLSVAKERNLNEMLELAFQRKQAPEEREIEVKELEGVPDEDELDWPITPTHYVTIAYATDEFSHTVIFENIVHDQNRWWIVLPTLKEEFLDDSK